MSVASRKGLANRVHSNPGIIDAVDSVQIIGSKARKKLVSELQLQQRHYIMDATVKELDRKLGDDTGKVGVDRCG